MENVNLHKQKLIAVAAAALAFIAILLPWSSGKGQFGAAGENGFHSWGLLSLLGVIAVVIATFLGDKTKAYEGQHKQIAMAGFGLIALGAILWLLRVLTGSETTQGFTIKYSDLVSPGVGLFIALVAGLAGLAWVMGLIKMPTNKPPTTPPTPPTPPPAPKA